MLRSILWRAVGWAACCVGADDGDHVVLGGQSVSMLHSILVWVVRWTTRRVEAHDRQYAALGSLFRSMLCSAQ